MIRYFYNDSKLEIKRKFYDSNEELTENIYGVAIVRYTYDDGEVIEERYFDKNDNKI